MADYKSLDYLSQIKKDNIMTNKDMIEMLENLGYFLTDNGYDSARYFLDEVIDNLEKNEINID